MSTLDNVLPAMDFIYKQFEHYKELHKHNKTMTLMFNSGWSKLEKYYNITDKSPAYVAVIVLDPNSKRTYIKNNWRKA